MRMTYSSSEHRREQLCVRVSRCEAIAEEMKMYTLFILKCLSFLVKNKLNGDKHLGTKEYSDISNDYLLASLS
jgi:hypothetical protein